MIKRCLVILVLVALLTQLFPGHLLPTTSVQAQEPSPASKISSLLALQVQAKLRAVKAGGLAAAANATQQAGLFNALQSQGMRLEDLNKQQVFIHLTQPLTQSQIAELQTNNITLNLDSWLPPVGSHPTGFILADMPVDKLQTLAEKGYVVRLETAERLLEPQNDLGTQKMSVPAVWASGYNGTGVRIAVLDSGLDLTHPDIPTPVAKKDYSAWPALDDTIANTVTGHGTHVAGSVLGRGTRSGGVYKGSAPSADLIFLKIGRDSDGRAPVLGMVNAIKAATDNYSADIITMSYGGWDTYHDGTSEQSQAVDYAVSRGAVVFISAGNKANDNQHYSGTVAAGSTTDFISVNVTGAGTSNTYLDFNLVWYDGLSTSNNLSMQFYDSVQSPLATFNTAQSQSTRGTESREAWYGTSSALSAVPSGNSNPYVKVTNNSTSSQFFHIYVWYSGTGSVTFQNADPNYTIGSPADADSAIAVGAYTTRKVWYDYANNAWQSTAETVDQIATFSSRGPRVDTGAPGKPNIVAPGKNIISARDDVVYPWANRSAYYVDNDGPNRSNAAGGSNDGNGPADYYVMGGTSMATPLAAGVAALILQKNPGWTPAQVKQALETTATDKGTSGWDSTYGWGLVNALAASSEPLGKIVFVSDRDANLEIYAMNANGDNQTRLTSNSAYDNMPFPSPDGSKIAFVSGRDGNREIYVMSANDTGVTQLTVTSNIRNDWPAWSPDGTRITFTSNRDGNAEIYVMNANGDNQTRLTSSPKPDDFPVWSPDGSKIAFASNRDGDFAEIYVMNANGDNQTRLTNNPAGDNFPFWSPDGTRITFTSNRDGNAEIYVMNANGDNQTRLTNTPGYNNFQPVGLKGAPKIVFTSNRDGNAEIYVMNANGDNQTRLTNNSPVGDWSRGIWVAPTVTSDNATNITGNSAVLRGTLTSLGSYSSANVSSDWGTTSGNYTNSTTSVSVNVTGAFSANLSSLSSNTTYYFRAKAVGDGIAYGNELSFTTTALAPPPPFLLKWGSTGSGDGQFSNLRGVAVDASGNVYVADMGNNRIQKFTSSGSFITKWGTTGSGNGQFNSPFAIAVDVSGNVYVTDLFNSRIQKFTSSGTFVTKWGTSGSGDGQFSSPQGIAVDASGNVYVADFSNNRIQKFTSSGTFTTKWGTEGLGDGQFSSPQGVAVDGSGNVYVADGGNSRVQKFTSSGNFTTKWASSGDGQFSSPYGIATDASGNIYVTDIYPSIYRVQRFTSSGVFIDKFGTSGSGDGQFIAPSAIAISASGNLYVADSGNNRIQVFGDSLLPVVATSAADNIRTGSARLWGNLTGLGLASSANVSFEWGTTSGNLTQQTTPQITTSTGNFSANLTALSANTTHYFRAKAVADNMTAYGNQLSFVTTTSLVAETALVGGLSANTTGVIVLKVNISRFKDPTDNSTANLSGGIGSFSATVTTNPSSFIQLLTVYGVPAIGSPSFNATTGVFGIANIASPIQPNNTTVAEVVPILTGNVTTNITLTVAFQTIGAAGQPGLNVPEEGANSITLRRGNVKEDALVDIFDALFIAQYIVGQRTLAQINALNAASVKHDGAGGDKIDIFDALFIAQYIVGQKNAYFQ